MFIPFDRPDSAVARELDRLAATSCLQTKLSLHAAVHEGRKFGWLIDDIASRDLDGYGATANSDSARCGYCGGTHDSVCGVRRGIRDRNGLRGHSIRDSHDDCDHSSDHGRRLLPPVGQRPTLGAAETVSAAVKNRKLKYLVARCMLGPP